MDTSRSDRIRRRTSDGTNRRPGRRASEACEEEQPAARRLRGSVIAPPIITVRANVERNRVPEPSPRLPPEDTRAQIVNLETQIERLQLRLLENRLIENREEARRSRLRADLSSDPTRPPPLFSSDRNSMPPRVSGSDDASSRGGGVRLSSSMAEGANGSAHNEEDERMRRSIRQRLGELARDPQVEPSPQPLMFPPSLSPPANRSPSRTNRAAADENPFRRNIFRRRNSLADSTVGDPWTEPIRNNRGLWRLEDSNLQDGDSDMESLHSSEPRRQLFEAHRAAHYARSPETTASNPAAARERFRAIWGDIDTEDYVSPITSLFQRSWANTLSPDRGRRPEGSGDRPAASTAPDRTAAETDSPAQARLQQIHLDLFRDALASSSPSLDSRRDANRAASERFRARRDALRGDEPPSPAAAASSLDTQKGRPEPMEQEDMKLDCECKICFGQIADTVLLPCSHLVICKWCADQIGAKPKDKFVRTAAQVLCPMCRSAVNDRITVFRG